MAHKIINITEDGGITKEILHEGEGDLHPHTDQTVEGILFKSSFKYRQIFQLLVLYTGKLLDGTVFDSSTNKDEPFSFTIGKGQVIKGWDLGNQLNWCIQRNFIYILHVLGVASMKKGEKALLTCTAPNAYGDTGSPPTIPPKATL